MIDNLSIFKNSDSDIRFVVGWLVVFLLLLLFNSISVYPETEKEERNDRREEK